MKKPSLALIPSGYKAGKVYSILPNNGVGDFTFSRNTSATRVNKNGFIETVDSNVPRLDYLDGGCPSLLLERSSTNLITRSENFDDTLWVKNNVDITTADIISPTGELNATKMTINSSNQPRRIYFVLSNTQRKFTVSLFVKKGSSDIIILKTSSGSIDTTFNISTQSVISGSGEIKDYGNGWYRIETGERANTTTEVLQIVLPSTDDVGNFLYIYGAQFEQFANSTSYIPSFESTTTRNQDICTDAMLNSPIITSDDWTLFFDLDSSMVITSGRISLNDGTSSNRILLEYDASINRFKFSTTNSNAKINQEDITTTERIKAAMVSTDDGYDLYANGAFVASKTEGRFDASSMVSLDFTQNSTNMGFIGKVYGLRYYNEPLTSAEAIELTTL